MELEYCYMCGVRATSKEHVPPKCLFPESKEMNGENYRENLITVPSCNTHNLEKSHDDEFLMVSLAGIFGNNSIGYRHKLGKVDRAIKRSSKRLIDKVFLKKKTYVVKGTNNFYEVIWGTPDQARLERCFEHIAYGLYAKYYGNRFIGNLKILLGYLHHKDSNSKIFVEFIKHRASIDLEGIDRVGNNQDVFYYKFTKPDQFGIFLAHLVFYGGISVYISFIPHNLKIPAHLGMELMNNGTHTVIELEDKIYEFNKS